MLKKVVIIGPESTGKSTLSAQLADHYGTTWCPEFAREYLLTNGANYSFEDLLSIAKGQLAMEDEYALMLENQSAPLLEQGGHIPLFIDTDLYVIKVWSEFAFGQGHRFVLEEITRRNYDLYLLTQTDLPWAADEFREYPDLQTRQRLYRMYKDILINQHVPWVEIHGDYDQRLRLATQAVDRLLE